MSNGGGSTVPVIGSVTPSSPDLSVTTNLAPPVINVHLKLCFWEPEKRVRRPFPSGLMVRVGSNEYPVQADGYVTFPAVRPSPPGKWRFTLEFPATRPRYVVCGPWTTGTSPPASPPAGSPPRYPALADNAPDTTERFFQLPSDFGSPMQPWALVNSDWEIAGPGSPPNASPASPPASNITFDPTTGILEHQNADQPVGAQNSPVVLTLDPKWLFFRFEFFDRYFGHSDHSNARVTTPPLPLEGFRNDRAAAGANPDTKSNWVIGDNARSLFQCLPFIVRRTHARVSLVNNLDGQNVGLRFHYDDDRYVFSESADVRTVMAIPQGDNRLKPGPDRLRYYDLPRTWKSRHYYTRWGGSPAGGAFFNEAAINAAKLGGADARNKALTFCLDDIVLYELSGANIQPLASWNATDRVAIFNHRFNSTIGGAKTTTHGLYESQAPAAMPNQFNIPQSNVTITRIPPPAGARDTYLNDYPDWTRLVIAQGNLFDVFASRAPDNADADRVVGARAAVRWIDATSTFPGITTEEWGWVVPPPPPPGVAGWVAATAPHNPIPGRRLSGAVNRIDQPAVDPLFSLQPFHFQNCTEFAKHYDPNNTTWFGRFDMLLLRCCDVDNGHEIATNVHYVRSYWDGIANTTPGKTWSLNGSINVSQRWNGNDTINNCRAVLVPDASPARPLRVQVVWFDQAVEQAKAHFGLTAGAGRSNRGSEDGTGEYSAADNTSQADGWFTSAHESGHMNGFPDDYNERWNCASYDQLSFRHNGPPGDPYEPDGRDDQNIWGTQAAGVHSGSMMNVNCRIRGRLYWPSAEWVSRVCGFPLKVKFTDPLSAPAVEYEYSLPAHPSRNDDRTYLSWPFLNNRNATTNAVPPGTSPPMLGSPPPPGTPWDSFEYNLYVLGKDYYSQQGLGRLVADARAARGLPALASQPRFDGLLVINLRLRCTLPADATVATEDANRQDLATRIFAATRKGLCFRWRLQGDFGSPPQRFNNCLIHFVPQIVVQNDPNGHYPAKSWDVAALTGEYGFHFDFEAQESTASPAVAASRWDVLNRKLTVDFRPGQYADVEAQLQREIPKFLGIQGTSAAVTAANVTPIVNLLGGANIVVGDIT